MYPMNLETLFPRVNLCETQDQLLALGAELASSMGFDYFTLGCKRMSSFSNPDVQWVSNYPMAWLIEYNAKNYIAKDPTLMAAASSNKPVVWNTEFFSHAPDLWEDANKHGIYHGWALGIHNIRGDLGVMVLARNSRDLTPQEQASKLPIFTAVAHVMHEQLSVILSHADSITPYSTEPEPRPHLTEREVEVLRFTADGKTASDISEILGIAERTVNFHVNNILLRLSVPNKTAAVARAASQGLL